MCFLIVSACTERSNERQCLSVLEQAPTLLASACWSTNQVAWNTPRTHYDSQAYASLVIVTMATNQSNHSTTSGTTASVGQANASGANGGNSQNRGAAPSETRRASQQLSTVVLNSLRVPGDSRGEELQVYSDYSGSNGTSNGAH
ncbi:hypothetical protein IQ07DRAFT_593691 [Pyrenochaeta sp. DS3sAY3a]|nr:hypothetical protein IQ07DRAFT_593691 [Pyrenochaeta sp. DS3sAY3a]